MTQTGLSADPHADLLRKLIDIKREIGMCRIELHDGFGAISRFLENYSQYLRE